MSASCSFNIFRKTSSGSRKDFGWDHGHDVNGDSNNAKCKYCYDIFTSGIYRFKHHLGGTRENVKCCTSLPDDVNKMLDILFKNYVSSKRKMNDIIDLGEDSIEEI